jgi:hypothetical protein
MATRKPPVTWSDEEWDKLMQAVDGKPGALTGRLIAAQTSLPVGRRRNPQAIYVARASLEARERDWRKKQARVVKPNKNAEAWLQANAPVPAAPMPPPATLPLSVMDALWGELEPRLRRLIREELAHGLLSRGDQANQQRVKLGQLYEAMPAEATRELVKVDVIGLLHNQAEQVKASDVGKRVSLRFIDAEKAGGIEPRDNVVLVTKFISHMIQDRVKARARNVLYANGAAGSVIAQLEQLMFDLATGTKQ